MSIEKKGRERNQTDHFVTRYSYSVGGVTHRFQYDVRLWTPSDAEQLARKYTPGQTMTVFYDIRSPQISTLRRGFHDEEYLAPFILATFYLGGLGPLVGVVRHCLHRSKNASGASKIPTFQRGGDVHVRPRPQLVLLPAAGIAGIACILFTLFVAVLMARLGSGTYVAHLCIFGYVAAPLAAIIAFSRSNYYAIWDRSEIIIKAVEKVLRVRGIRENGQWLSIPANQIRQFRVSVNSKCRLGEEKYYPTLTYAAPGAPAREVVLTMYREKDRAHRLIAWLKTQTESTSSSELTDAQRWASQGKEPLLASPSSTRRRK